LQRIIEIVNNLPNVKYSNQKYRIGLFNALKAKKMRKIGVFAEVPRKVEYSLTPYGKSLFPVIVILREWGVKRLIDSPDLMSDNEELKAYMKVITSKEDLSFLDKFNI
jgi:hypothetical protein